MIPNTIRHKMMLRSFVMKKNSSRSNQHHHGSIIIRRVVFSDDSFRELIRSKISSSLRGKICPKD